MLRVVQTIRIRGSVPTKFCAFAALPSMTNFTTVSPLASAHQACLSTTTTSAEEDGSPISPVYVHHVSKIVLEHLQKSHSDWLVERGLDRGLHLAANGTFVLYFPSRPGFDAGRIWTSYDTSTKQHWLSVYRHKVVGRFLLKDGTASARATSSSLNAGQQMSVQIKRAVDELIATLEANDK